MSSWRSAYRPNSAVLTDLDQAFFTTGVMMTVFSDYEESPYRGIETAENSQIIKRFFLAE